jgi:hypothetical protein
LGTLLQPKPLDRFDDGRPADRLVEKKAADFSQRPKTEKTETGRFIPFCG